MTIKEFELELRRVEKDMVDSLKRRISEEGDWSRAAYLLKEVERWNTYSD